MHRSRTTLATIDAAAMHISLPSPPTMHRAGQGRAGARFPSTSTKSGTTANRNTARRIASNAAPRIFNRPISATDAAPSAISTHPAARAAINAANATSRAAGDSFFESSINPASPAGTLRGKTTAAAITGPASGPRPTSSTPAIRSPSRIPDATSPQAARRTLHPPPAPRYAPATNLKLGGHP